MKITALIASLLMLAFVAGASAQVDSTPANTPEWSPCHGPCILDWDDATGTGTPDGGITIDDFLYYLQIFAEGNPCADVDDGSFTNTPDGGVTIDDFLYIWMGDRCC